jgi:hypothetical protein
MLYFRLLLARLLWPLRFFQGALKIPAQGISDKLAQPKGRKELAVAMGSLALMFFGPLVIGAGLHLLLPDKNQGWLGDPAFQGALFMAPTLGLLAGIVGIPPLVKRYKQNFQDTLDDHARDIALLQERARLDKVLRKASAAPVLRRRL